MSVIVAMLQHETNTFSGIDTPLEAFAEPLGSNQVLTGSAAVEFFRGTKMAIGAFIDALEAENIDYAIPLAAYAEPSAAADDAAFSQLCDRICQAVAQGCDGVLLDLHGAMVTHGYTDAEGELLARIRRINAHVPIAVALDYHANISDQICQNADIVTGYLTYPHVDTYECGMRAAGLLLRTLAGEIKPRVLWKKAPMMTHMICQSPSQKPMKPIMDQAIEAELAGNVLAMSVFAGFPLADVPHVCLSAVAVVDENHDNADGYLKALISMAWQSRAEFVYRPEPLKKTIARAKNLDQGPIVLADHGDNAGAGGPHDNMAVIAEILRQKLDNVAVAPIADAQAVERLWQAGEGALVTLAVGGKVPTPALNLPAKPLVLSGRVKRLAPLRFTISGPMMTGFQVDLGRSAVFEVGNMEIIISEQRTEPADLGFFTHMGIDPSTKRYLVVKSRQHFRAGFEKLAREILLVAGPGVCSSDYEMFPFEKLTRPIYPLDQDVDFDPDSI